MKKILNKKSPLITKIKIISLLKDIIFVKIEIKVIYYKHT